MPNKNKGDKSRNTGILTQRDKEVLRGDANLSGSAERDALYRIREKTKSAFQDFELLQNELDDRNIRLIFESDAYYFNNIADLLSMTYLGIEKSDNFDNNERVIFENILHNAFHESTFREEIMYDVDIDIKIQKREPDVNETVEKIIRGDGSFTELSYLNSIGEADRIFEHVIENNEIITLTFLGDRSYTIDKREAKRMLD